MTMAMASSGTLSTGALPASLSWAAMFLEAAIAHIDSSGAITVQESALACMSLNPAGTVDVRISI